MAQLKIIEKGDSLTHAYIAISFEAHIGNGSPWVNQAHDVLCDNIKPWRLIKPQINSKLEPNYNFIN